MHSRTCFPLAALILAGPWCARATEPGRPTYDVALRLEPAARRATAALRVTWIEPRPRPGRRFGFRRARPLSAADRVRPGAGQGAGTGPRRPGRRPRPGHAAVDGPPGHGQPRPSRVLLALPRRRDDPGRRPADAARRRRVRHAGHAPDNAAARPAGPLGPMGRRDHARRLVADVGRPRARRLAADRRSCPGSRRSVARPVFTAPPCGCRPTRCSPAPGPWRRSATSATAGGT